MTAEISCRRCGRESWSPGRLNGALFRPDEAKFLTLETGNVSVRARMCTVCGAMELIGDVAKLERLLGEKAPSGEPDAS